MTAADRVANRIAVVTGGASGIGLGIAEALTAAGATVVIADIEEGPLASAAARIGADAVRVDVSDAASVQSLADTVRERFGRIDIVCNNAGVGHLAPFSDLTLADFRWVLGVNLWGVIHGMSTFLPIVQETSDAGWIVNTASMAGLFDAPGMAAYAASKFAVVAVSETIAQELELAGSAVGVSVLVPGLVNTAIANSERNRPDAVRGAPPQLDQIPPGRALDPRHVGELVVEAIRAGDRYIVTHPEMLPIVRDRHARIEAAFEAAALAEQTP
ncbi:SDR family NAD(P)-dependent oxidoreductase [Microbacterium aurantiacum]|uniref:SDR family NAD(P)-dependent oxidoreductase n=1 Tax=Microbacterium aurantiacum TaxID=162393 RepID=UPI0040362D54